MNRFIFFLGHNKNFLFGVFPEGTDKLLLPTKDFYKQEGECSIQPCWMFSAIFTEGLVQFAGPEGNSNAQCTPHASPSLSTHENRIEESKPAPGNSSWNVPQLGLLYECTSWFAPQPGTMRAVLLEQLYISLIYL